MHRGSMAPDAGPVSRRSMSWWRALLCAGAVLVAPSCGLWPARLDLRAANWVVVHDRDRSVISADVPLSGYDFNCSSLLQVAGSGSHLYRGGVDVQQELGTARILFIVFPQDQPQVAELLEVPALELVFRETAIIATWDGAIAEIDTAVVKAAFQTALHLAVQAAEQAEARQRQADRDRWLPRRRSRG